MVKLLIIAVTTIYGGVGGFTTGYGLIITSDINNHISDYNMQKIKGTWLNGGSGYAFIDKVIMGGSGYGGSTKKTKDSTFVRYGTGGGYFEAGYIPWTLKPVSFFVMMGIGGYVEDLTIGKIEGPSSFNDAWQNYKNETHISRSGFSLSPSLGVIFFPQKSPVGLMLQIFYNSILSKTWKYDDDSKLSTAPNTPLGGFSMEITILSGGIGYGKQGN